MIVPSVDIYATYRCNLRCSHCFVGENLSLNSHFPFADLYALIQALPQWKTKAVTFLGAEPTLYPCILEAVELVQSLGMQARIVTNGLHGFANFMKRFDGSDKLT
jgi:MoaA/NifB/PqqE/SkfB family radical SAM enzyme